MERLPAIRKPLVPVTRGGDPIDALDRIAQDLARIQEPHGYQPRPSLRTRFRNWDERDHKWFQFAGATLIIAGIIGVGTAAVGAMIVGIGLWYNVPWIWPWKDVPVAESTFTDTGSRTLTMTMDSNGWFSTTCKAGNAAFRCIIDTGTGRGNGMLMIDRDTAKKVGIDVMSLRFSGSSGDMYGSLHMAKATVAHLQVGPFVVQNAPVVVQDSALDVALLTTEFLRHYKMTVSNGTMTISE